MNEVQRYRKLARLYGSRARRAHFMQRNQELALHWQMKALAALGCLQAQIVIEARR